VLRLARPLLQIRTETEKSSARQALVNNLLVRMYHQGLEISIPQYARFKEIAQLAASKKQSLLILPCHKSHIVRALFSLSGHLSLLTPFSASGLSECGGLSLHVVHAIVAVTASASRRPGSTADTSSTRSHLLALLPSGPLVAAHHRWRKPQHADPRTSLVEMRRRLHSALVRR
jgi:hypothetical protein